MTKTYYRSINKTNEFKSSTRLNQRASDHNYTRKETLGLNILMGKPYITNIDLFNQKISFVSYLRSTNPLLGIGFNNASYNKFTPGHNMTLNQLYKENSHRFNQSLSPPSKIVISNLRDGVYISSKVYNIFIKETRRLMTSYIIPPAPPLT